MNNKLTENFTWDEVTFSETAIRLGLDNHVPDELLPNVQRMANFMEQLRFAIGGRPINITSWYRSPEVNAAIGGSKTSAHMKGLACDFKCPYLGNPLAVARFVAESNLDFDQVIHEFGRWVHVGLAEGNRRQLLTAYRGSEGQTIYLNHLVEIPT
mgnify:CR=1 FL=1